jgi:predicted porin
MKKTLIALAAVAVSGAAFAQATITGSIAFSVQNTVKDQANRLDLSDADINFAASEDLGGGLKASVSTSISNEALRGRGTTANNTTAALSGAFGTLSYVNVLSGQSKLSAGVSAEDDMSDAMGGYATVNVLDYTLPSFIPNTSLTLEWAASDAANMELAGQPALIANYKDGPLAVYAEVSTDGKSAWDIRPSYDAGVAKLAFRATSSKKQEFAVTAPMGALTVGLHYVKGAAKTQAAADAVTDANTKNATDAAANKALLAPATVPTVGYIGKATGVSVSYALSKRTSVNASYVTGDFANVEKTGSNYRVQLKHAF